MPALCRRVLLPVPSCSSRPGVVEMVQANSLGVRWAVSSRGRLRKDPER